MDFTTSPRSDAQSQMSLGNLTLTKFTSTGLFFDLSATIPVPHSSLPFGTFVIEPPFNVGVLYLGRSSGPWLLGNIDMGDNPIELRAGDPPCEVDLKHAFLKIVEPDWVRDSFIPRLINQDYEIVMDFALRVSGANFKVLGIPVQGVDLYREVKVNLSQWLSQAAIGSTTFDTVDINIGTDHTGIHVSVFAELGESLIPVSASVPSLSFDVCAITSVQSSPILATPRDSWCLGNINATVGIQSGLKINALVHGRLVAGNNPIRIFSSGTTATADFDLSSFRFNDQDGMTISFLEQMFSNSYTLFRSVQVPVTVDVTNFIRDAIMQVSSGLAVGGFSVSVNVTDEGVLATVVGTNIPSEFRVGPTSVKVSGSLLNGGGITIRIGETALGVVEWSGLNLQSGNMNATLLIHLVNGDEVETSVAFMIDSAMELARLMMSGAGQVPVSFPAAGVGDIGINIRDTTGQTGTLVLPVSATVSLARLFQQVLQSRNRDSSLHFRLLLH
ncbi:hypothetical protein BJ742DRAFT_835506 [Cladochytrium replicatum]|nr:hypothetical protein BJ742DRAFT_835506 [Cladochytrium replicatum]